MITSLLLLALLPRDDVGKLLVELREAKATTRYSIEIRLGNAADDRHIPIFLREIGRGPDDLRVSFVRVLRVLRTKKAVAALQAIQNRYDWKFRAEVAYALKICGEMSGINYLVANFASPRLKSKDRLAMVQYLQASYCGKKPEAVKVLCRVLVSGKNDTLRKRIVAVLVTHESPASVPVFQSILEDPKDPVYHDVLAALVSLGNQEAMETALVAVEEDRVPSSSCFTLFLAIQKRGTKSIFPRLRAALEKVKDTTLRMRIIETLSKLGDRKALKLFQELAKDKNAAVARAALDGILALAGRSQVPGLIKLLDDKNASNRIRVAKALLALDDISGLEVLRKGLSSENVTIRREAVTALGTVHRREMVGLLLIAMEDKDASLRRLAASSLTSTLQALHPYRKFNLRRMGYNPASSDDASRKQAVEKLSEWWAENAEK